MQFELAHLVDALPGLGWTALPDGRAEFLNQRWLAYTGLTAEQAMGSGWVEAIHPDDRQVLFDYWGACVTTGTLGDTEARLRRHDGSYRWFLFRANPLRDSDGNICRWFGLNIDIEDRKKAEESLRSNERNLTLIINTIPSLIHVLGTDGSVLFVNQAVLDYTGLTPEDTRKPDYRARLFHAEDLKRVHEERLASLRRPVPFELELRVRRRDGSYRWFLNRYNPLLDEHGKLDRWYAASFETEDLKGAQEELHNTRSALAHMTRVMTMGELTASIAHEINQPLAGIITNANSCLLMLASDEPNLERARETLHRTIRDANRAADVITRLRALFSHKETAAEPVDLTEATREVIALCNSELQRKGTQLRPELASDIPSVIGDRVQLQQVILNLLTNASDAMLGVQDRPRELLIKTELDNDGLVRVTVRDSGAGFDPRNAEKLFAPFYSTKPQGMGIGLSVSRSIIENHHGRIWATVNEGPGATFSFTIPS
jgi:PAS domain S-box-containing protein